MGNTFKSGFNGEKTLPLILAILIGAGAGYSFSMATYYAGTSFPTDDQTARSALQGAGYSAIVIYALLILWIMTTYQDKLGLSTETIFWFFLIISVWGVIWYSVALFDPEKPDINRDKFIVSGNFISALSVLVVWIILAIFGEKL